MALRHRGFGLGAEWRRGDELDDVAMGDRHPFGRPRGAGSIKHIGDFVSVRRWRGVGGGDSGGVDVDERNVVAVHERGQVTSGQNGQWCGVPEQESDAGAGVIRVDRQVGGSHFEDRQDCHDGAAAAWQQHRHHITGAYSAVG
ncbi:hypothetical protein NIIDMKKI_01020 [Mycobacterium kansasii]|uniref:Uncharacterized protein n=1 Tax=Mycobacterium kansasii TaxID=1768 RepID=A0A7G1I1H1_MYCKA|nr:hypothetical protein NIIDMKKI_01020 [Mycobacterium kansasii]